MASFSVDITEIVFAGGRTGYKDVTISNAPKNGIGISNTGYGTHFKVEVQTANIKYKISTKAANTSDKSYNSKIRFYNKADSNDYVEIQITQYSVTTIKTYTEPVHLTPTPSTGLYNLMLGNQQGSADLYIDLVKSGVNSIREVTAYSDWLSVTKETPDLLDTGFYHYTINYTSNTSAETRRGQIHCTARVSGNVETIIIEATQDAGAQPVSLSVSPTSTTVSDQSGSVKVTVTGAGASDISYDISASWITFDHKSGDDYYFNYTVNSGAERTGVVTFSATGFNSSTFTLQQNAGSSAGSLSVTPSSLSFGPDASYADISLTYGGTYFNTAADEVYTWVTVNMSDKGGGQATGTVSVPVNNTTASRKGNIYFTDEEGGSIALPVEQSGIQAVLSANPSSLNIPAEGGTVTTAVTYVGTLSAASLPSWLSETHTDTDSSHRTYSLTAASNGPTQERTFNWRLDDDYNNMYVFISQAAKIQSSLVISPTSQSVGSPAGTVEITVRSTNISDISYSISGDWITYSSKSGSVYTFSYEQNPTTSVREGTITFSGGGISRTFKLTQREGEVSLVISPISSSVGSSAGTVEITVSSSGISEISYNISGDWITYSSKSGDVYTFNYTENTTTSQRQGSITFSGGGISETFTLTQEGISSDAISVDKEIVCIPNNGGGGFTVTITYNGNVTVSKPSWVLNNTTSMTVNGKYKYTFSANARNEDGGKEPMRTDSLVFIGDNGTRTKVLICQGGYTYGRVPVIYPTKLNEFSADGGSQYLVVDYYKTLTISKGINWITVNRDESYNNDYSPSVYVVTAMRNIHSRRAGTFTLQGETGSYKIVDVSQAESSASSISVSPTELNYTAAGGTKSVTVSGGNGTINVNNGSFPSWLSVKSAGGGVYNLTTTKNTGKARSFAVWFTDNTSTVTMNVYQQAGDTPGPGPGPGPTPVVTGSLKAYPMRLRYYSDGGSIAVSFTNRPRAGIGYTITYTDGTGWLSAEKSDPNVIVTATKNTGIRRRASIKFYDLGDSKNYVIVPVIQGSEDGYSSIWMDDLFYPAEGSWDGSGNYYYRIVDKDTSYEYFSGVAVNIFPGTEGEGLGGIDIPRLVEYYINTTLEEQKTDTGWGDMSMGYCTVDVYNMTTSGYPGTVEATFKYWNDWSRFEKKYDYTRTLNDPINSKGCDNMIIPFCVYYDESSVFSIVDTERNGNVNTKTLSTPSKPFMMRTDSYYDSARIDYKQDGQILFSYDMTHCGQGALIYRNRFGGWDSFLIEGNISKTDNYTKQNYRKKGGYNLDYSIDTLKYIDEKRTEGVDIDTTYQAYTGWLTDEESERLVFHLLSSPTVFFQNLNKVNQLYDTDSEFGALLPVRITASSSEYKKFRNGKRLVNYLITFEKCNIEQVRR